MKIISLLALSIGMAMAQTNELHYDVLRTLDGQTISNATVKPMNAAYVVVLTETGGEKIAFTNLSSDVQRQFDYDPARAQAELDLQERRKLEAQERFEAQAKARADAEKDRLFRIVGDNI